MVFSQATTKTPINESCEYLKESTIRILIKKL